MKKIQISSGEGGGLTHTVGSAVEQCFAISPKSSVVCIVLVLPGTCLFVTVLTVHVVEA